MGSPPPCPGRYCGRLSPSPLDNSSELFNNDVVCGACPRGFRADERSVCRPCGESPLLYDWLYLGFTAALPFMLNCFFIEFSARRKATRRLLCLQHLVATLECGLSGLVTLFVASPAGSLTVASCRVNRLSDWYTVFFNPYVRHVHHLRCTQEAVYPLYSLPFIYYSLNLLLLLTARVISINCIFGKMFRNTGFSSAVYAALYFYPILIIVHACCAGFIYYAFPYILLLVCLIVNVLHLTAYDTQTLNGIMKDTVNKSRNFLGFCTFSVIYAYCVISITRFNDVVLFSCLFAFIPLPTLFYALTSAFSEPSRLSKVP